MHSSQYVQLAIMEKSVAQSLWGEAAPEGKTAVHWNLKGNLRRDGVSVCVYAFKSEARKLWGLCGTFPGAYH